MLGVIRYAAVLPTGEIVQTGTAPSFAAMAMIAIPGATVEVAPEWVDDNKHYWDAATKAFVAFPPKPGPWAAWDGQCWFDPRTAADLDARRAAASITKSAFLQACLAVGLLNPAEAADAARGYNPGPLRSGHRRPAGLPAEQRDMIEVIWPAVTRVDRMDPLILAVAASAGLGDALLDEIFGLAPQSPD